MIDLVQHARGIREGWYSAQVLDDQPETIDPEQKVLDHLKIEHDLQARPRDFFVSLLQWTHEYSRKRKVERAETRRVLVIDVNLTGLVDVATLTDIDGLTLDSDTDTDTLKGRRAGLVLVDAFLRSSPIFRKLPIVILSGYGIEGAENRLEHIKAKKGAPVHFIKKSVVGEIGEGEAAAAEEFKDVVGELLYDDRLLFVQKLANFWRLEPDECCGMLGVRKHDPKLIAQLFDRGADYPNHDADQRVRLLLTMHENLYSLIRNQDEICGWLNAKNGELDGRRPIELISSGDFERLAVVKHYIDFICME